MNRPPGDAEPGYYTKDENIVIKGAADLSIRSLLDNQQFADPLGLAQALGISSAMWPLFGLLWPSAAYLAARVVLRPVSAAERILEVGCGLGLASLAAHRRGADITASDIHPLAELFLLENLRRNGLGPMKYRHGDWAPLLIQAIAPKATPTAALSQAAGGGYDLIIGSDLLYDRDASSALAGFLAWHAAPRAEIWIVDPNRGNRPAFNQRMGAAGFRRHEDALSAPASLSSAAYKGRMLTYQRG